MDEVTHEQALELAKLMVEALDGRGLRANSVEMPGGSTWWSVEAQAAKGQRYRLRAQPSVCFGRVYAVDYYHGTGWVNYGTYTGPHAAFMALCNLA